MTKVCPRCEVDKPTAEFSKNKNRRDGLQAYCKTCTSAANRASDAKNKSRASIDYPATKLCKACGETKPGAEFFKDSRQSDGLYAACKPCHAGRTTQWKRRNPHAVKAIRNRTYSKNADKNRAYTREWRKSNTARARKSAAEWKLQNRRQATALELTRQKRTRNAPGKATSEQILARWAYYGDKCWMCGADAEHTDHVKPISKGGSNWPSNLRPACASCNLAKRDTWPYLLAA